MIPIACKITNFSLCLCCIELPDIFPKCFLHFSVALLYSFDTRNLWRSNFRSNRQMCCSSTKKWMKWLNLFFCQFFSSLYSSIVRSGKDWKSASWCKIPTCPINSNVKQWILLIQFVVSEKPSVISTYFLHRLQVMMPAHRLWTTLGGDPNLFSDRVQWSIMLLVDRVV